MARSRFAGQFAWVSGGRIVAALLQALSLVLAARLLTPAEFGILAVVLSLTTIPQTALDFGVSTFIIRERASTPGSGALATALRFNLVTSVALMALGFGILTAVGTLSNSIYLLMLPLAVWASAERNADARLSIAFADGDAKVNVINLVGRRSLAIVLFLGLAQVSIEPVLAFATASACAALLSSIFANAYIRGRVTRTRSITFRELLSRSRPYWVHSIATQARNLDVVVVGSLSGATQAGYFSTASRLTNPLKILPSSLASLLLPAVSRANAESSSIRRLLQLSAVIVAIMTVLYAIIIVLTPAMVPVILGDPYRPAVPIIQVVVAGLPFAAAAALLSSILQGQGHKKVVATVSAITTAVSLSSAAALCSMWDAMGAALALSASFAVQLGILIAAFVRLRKGGKP